jgi:glutaminyl-peptide cyclotransferase
VYFSLETRCILRKFRLFGSTLRALVRLFSHPVLVLVASTCFVAWASPEQREAGRFSGTAAFAYTRQAVAFGERASGSENLKKTREWIVSQLKPLGGELKLDAFNGQTPAGPIPMVNIILKFAGTSGKAIAITGHYDTKKIPMVNFVGANDGGSSTGFLIELARVLAQSKPLDDLYIVFFDGEEAVGNWTDTDSRYGSRHLANQWLSDGSLARLRALINVDMIGDRNLDLADDENSSESLRAQMRQIAAKQGDSAALRKDAGAIDDDHKPFADVGVNVIDIIDLNYGPSNSYWHTAQDTMDKLSARSFQVVGDIVLGLIRELERGG